MEPTSSPGMDFRPAAIKKAADSQDNQIAGLRASASASASTSLGGVSGVSLNSTTSPRRASFTALNMAAGGGMAPPSPTPLMP